MQPQGQPSGMVWTCHVKGEQPQALLWNVRRGAQKLQIVLISLGGHEMAAATFKTAVLNCDHLALDVTGARPFTVRVLAFPLQQQYHRPKHQRQHPGLQFLLVTAYI
mmetsp:Transcript_1152/g.2245  ORF Transcript_1152/g.2245 Transcript_1152/m.2245 type:complete len:107 (-) Transcript_1152:803-1123(-)